MRGRGERVGRRSPLHLRGSRSGSPRKPSQYDFPGECRRTGGTRSGGGLPGLTSFREGERSLEPSAPRAGAKRHISRAPPLQNRPRDTHAISRGLFCGHATSQRGSPPIASGRRMVLRRRGRTSNLDPVAGLRRQRLLRQLRDAELPSPDAAGTGQFRSCSTRALVALRRRHHGATSISRAPPRGAHRDRAAGCAPSSPASFVGRRFTYPATSGTRSTMRGTRRRVNLARPGATSCSAAYADYQRNTATADLIFSQDPYLQRLFTELGLTAAPRRGLPFLHERPAALAAGLRPGTGDQRRPWRFLGGLEAGWNSYDDSRQQLRFRVFLRPGPRHPATPMAERSSRLTLLRKVVGPLDVFGALNWWTRSTDISGTVRAGRGSFGLSVKVNDVPHSPALRPGDQAVSSSATTPEPGRLTDGAPRMAGVRVQLDGSREVLTDKDGRFVLHRCRIGRASGLARRARAGHVLHHSSALSTADNRDSSSASPWRRADQRAGGERRRRPDPQRGRAPHGSRGETRAPHRRRGTVRLRHPRRGLRALHPARLHPLRLRAGQPRPGDHRAHARRAAESHLSDPGQPAPSPDGWTRRSPVGSRSSSTTSSTRTSCCAPPTPHPTERTRSGASSRDATRWSSSSTATSPRRRSPSSTQPIIVRNVVILAPEPDAPPRRRGPKRRR
jgi:hypothetical protein